MNLILRAATVSDDSAVREIHEKAFAQKEEANLVEAISRGASFIKDLSIVAVLSEQIVGHILYSPVKLEKQPERKLLALAPLAVLPEHQNKGIGSDLIRAGNIKADLLGYEMITVLGEPQYYQRFGFETSTIYGIKCPFEVEADCYMVLPLSHHRKGTAGLVIYPDAFQNV